ncbi:MarR family winged helix-turn-helix transcriptional regulator [Nonomuraea typhae]|uniref:MarR family winged helix-turn-helix transcriptional regulator n=1 Tax=Nonomuraea typhae TaxID=2603600 RepID=A0ABW7YLJ6_9ACTN
MAMTQHQDAPDTPARLRALPTRLLAKASAQADRVVTAGLAAADAGKWHYAVLVALDDGGPASQAELSRRTGIYRSDMVAVLNALAGRDLIERAADPADRRRNVITLTPSGRAFTARLDLLVAELQDEALAPLAPAEREQLTRLLRRLAER